MKIWKTEEIRDEIYFDSCIIMPNHIHFIMVVNENNKNVVVGDAGLRPLQQDHDITKNHVSNTIQRIKSSITRKIRQNYGDYEFAWQRSFYDVIIRNDEQLLKTRQYIEDNPKKWIEDVNFSE